MFIEPDEHNFNRLTKYFSEKFKVNKDRYFLIRAAISDKCNENGQITYYKPRPTVAQKQTEAFEDSTLANELGSLSKDVVAGVVTRFRSEGYDAALVPCLSMRQAIHMANEYFVTRPTTIFSTQHVEKSYPEVFSFWPIHTRVGMLLYVSLIQSFSLMYPYLFSIYI